MTTRRDILKAHAAAVAALAANVSLPAAAQPVEGGIEIAENQMVESALPLLRHRLRRHGRREGRTASSPRTATRRPRSIAA